MRCGRIKCSSRFCLTELRKAAKAKQIFTLTALGGPNLRNPRDEWVPVASDCLAFALWKGMIKRWETCSNWQTHTTLPQRLSPTFNLKLNTESAMKHIENIQSWKQAVVSFCLNATAEAWTSSKWHHWVRKGLSQRQLKVRKSLSASWEKWASELEKGRKGKPNFHFDCLGWAKLKKIHEMNGYLMPATTSLSLYEKGW